MKQPEKTFEELVIQKIIQGYHIRIMPVLGGAKNTMYFILHSPPAYTKQFEVTYEFAKDAGLSHVLNILEAKIQDSKKGSKL